MFINQKITKFCFFLLFFSIFPSISQANEGVPLNNIAINETVRPVSPVIFEDFSGNEISLTDFRGKLLLINFWATWCAPCKKEMPSLDLLYQKSDFKNLKIFAVNMENPNQSKTKNFFTNLNINNLEIFFDKDFDFVREFKLRGMPTTILINKKGEEFAKIIGEVNFVDKKFVKWLLKYD